MKTIVVLILIIHAVFSENLYVREDGFGNNTSNGMDWNTAFSGFSAIVWGEGFGKIGAGDTLYMAGGIYTSHLTVKADGARNSKITILRATATNHGTMAGWNDSLDGLIDIRAAYIDLRSRSFIEVNNKGRRQ